MSKKIKLSVCLAVHNEGKTIHIPLNSIIDIADEVVVVDGSSTDRTVEVARSFGKKVRVIETDNPPMFHINKQKAIEAARGDWILQLDADEEVSKELKEKIKEIIFNGKNSEFVAFNLPRKNFFLTRFLKKGGQYPDYTIRLYRRGKVYFPCETVHENVKLVNKEDKIGFLKSPLYHYADPSFSRYLMRWDRYTSLDTDLILKEGKKISFFNYFVVKPLLNFFSIYVRHKGFYDGFAGFVFALFSSIRFWAVYIKYRTKKYRMAKNSLPLKT